jgi:GNAT superfamily N-acetyltransferase
MAKIRLINLSTKEASDWADLDTIFRTTSGPDFKSEPTATIASYIYCHQYPYISSQTCFVLESETGKAVGYILGTPDTASFATQWRQDFPRVLAKLAEIGVEHPPDYAAEGREKPKFEDDAAASLLYEACYKPEEMLNVGIAGLWEKWPAHFHVDILPEFQRLGWGRKLIETMMGALRDAGARGVHLGMEAPLGGSNGVEKFYASMGFERYPGVLDGGVSGEMGRVDERVVYLVKTLK